MKAQKPYFPMLEAKIAECGVVKKDMANIICINPRTLSLKLAGKTEFTLREIWNIHKLFPDLSIEQLFQHDEKGA